MSFGTLLSKPEFWSALFGALAAFLLGALGTWWANTSSKSTAGNVTLVVLGQMYSLMENLRLRLFVDEPIRFFGMAKRSPNSFELRGTVGLPSEPPHVPLDQLGFLANSRDPDLMNRLLTVERAFRAMLDMTTRHHQLHDNLTARVNQLDPSGHRPMRPQDLVDGVGIKPFLEIDDVVEELRTGLPETRDALLEISKQLRGELRLQFPFRRFIKFGPIARSRNMSQPPDLPDPAIWRYVARWIFDTIRNPTPLPAWLQPKPEPPPPDPKPPEVMRFPPRSYEQPQLGTSASGPGRAG